jgi:hypothetical protein
MLVLALVGSYLSHAVVRVLPSARVSVDPEEK